MLRVIKSSICTSQLSSLSLSLQKSTLLDSRQLCAKHFASMEPSAEPAKDFLSFVNSSPTPYHAVHSVKERLEQAGFEKLSEREDWSTTCKTGGKFYVSRNASSIIAFAIGQDWRPGNPIAMVGAHTDSPCLRVKPISKHHAEGFLQVGVEC